MEIMMDGNNQSGSSHTMSIVPDARLWTRERQGTREGGVGFCSGP